MSETDAIQRFTILGCGSSGGVPRVGGVWGACDPNEPRNRRTRCSLLVEHRRAEQSWDEATTVLIDTAPDMREQLLAVGVTRIDAVLYTHDHADQTHGIDDLRALAQTMRRRVPVHMDAATATTLTDRFRYCFHQRPGSLYPPILDARVDLKAGKPLSVEGPGGGLEILPLDQEHGPTRSLGFRFGDVAYSNDVSAMPEDTFARLGGLSVWIVDTLRYRPHVSHANLETALGWIERLRPGRAILTNLHVDLDYRRLCEETPDHVAPGYDGMQFELPAKTASRIEVS